MPSKRLLEARFCAVGGQGIVLGTEIIATAAIFYQGLYAMQCPTYGSQVRGGATKVDLIIDDKEILNPKAQHINFFMAIAQSSFNKFWKDEEIADDAVVLLDSNLVKTTAIPETMRKQRIFIDLPVVEIAKKEFNNVLLSNMMALGVTCEMTKIISAENYLKSIEKKVPPKHLDKNIQAFNLGIEMAKEHAAKQSAVVA
jgi:2-oxoglutarate ferredoxin oxidoreductase subunit gamma